MLSVRCSKFNPLPFSLEKCQFTIETPCRAEPVVGGFGPCASIVISIQGTKPPSNGTAAPNCMLERATAFPAAIFHHVPPKNGPCVSGEELEASELLTTYRPDYFVSGHDHAFPYTFWPKLETKNERSLLARRIGRSQLASFRVWRSRKTGIPTRTPEDGRSSKDFDA
jgi:hypothetical protein